MPIEPPYSWTFGTFVSNIQPLSSFQYIKFSIWNYIYHYTSTKLLNWTPKILHFVPRSRRIISLAPQLSPLISENMTGRVDSSVDLFVTIAAIFFTKTWYFHDGDAIIFPVNKDPLKATIVKSVSKLHWQLLLDLKMENDIWRHLISSCLPKCIFYVFIKSLPPKIHVSIFKYFQLIPPSPISIWMFSSNLKSFDELINSSSSALAFCEFHLNCWNLFQVEIY